MRPDKMIKVDVGRFLGIRRITAVYLVVFLLLLSFGTNLFMVWRIQNIAHEAAHATISLRDLANKNATAVKALCLFRSDLVDRRNANRDFLKLTLDERIQKYGQIGNIPDSVIKTNLMSQNRTIDSLRSLECPLPKKS